MARIVFDPKSCMKEVEVKAPSLFLYFVPRCIDCAYVDEASSRRDHINYNVTQLPCFCLFIRTDDVDEDTAPFPTAAADDDDELAGGGPCSPGMHGLRYFTYASMTSVLGFL